MKRERERKKIGILSMTHKNALGSKIGKKREKRGAGQADGKEERAAAGRDKRSVSLSLPPFSLNMVRLLLIALC